MKLLVCSDGSASSLPALSYGRWLAPTLRCPVTVLGVQEGDRPKPLLERAIEETAGRLAEHGIRVEVRFDRGRAERVIPPAAGPDTLTILGPFEQHGRTAHRGGTFRRLLASMETPLLFVPTAIMPLEHLLICSGGSAYAETLTQVALRLAAATHARVTFLHVLEPSSEGSGSTLLTQASWQGLLDRPEGRYLRESLDWASALGLQADIRLRRGQPVHEILDEASGASYSLLGLGTRHSAPGNRSQPDVTAEVAELGQAPVLAVRYGHPLTIGADA